MKKKSIRDTPVIVIPKGYTVDEMLDFDDEGYENGEPVAEIKVYQKAVKPEKQVYGKYGTLAKQYLEDKGIDWTIANLPEYLHGVDKSADDLYETLYEKFSKEERFRRSGDFMENLKRQTEMQRLIEEEILNEIVYVK